jgi:hypothetical protein
VLVDYQTNDIPEEMNLPPPGTNQKDKETEDWSLPVNITSMSAHPQSRAGLWRFCLKRIFVGIILILKNRVKISLKKTKKKKKNGRYKWKPELIQIKYKDYKTYDICLQRKRKENNSNPVQEPQH